MIKVKASEVQGIADVMRELEIEVNVQLRKIAEYIGINTIAYLREFINETRPPVRPGEPARKARQGHWADNTGNLARAYSYEVESSGNTVTLTLLNSMDYAAALDVKEGFFVLRGVTDKGGPVEMMMRKAVALIAPDAEVLSYD